MRTGEVGVEDEALKAWIQKLPKAELHIHFEGAFRWQSVRACHPEGAALPERNPWASSKKQHSFFDFKNFLNAFQYTLKPATGTEEFIERHMYEVLEDLALQNVKYVELTIGPPFHAGSGLSLEQIFEAMARGKCAAEKAFGIQVEFLLGLQRHDKPCDVLAYCKQSIAIAGPSALNILAGVDLQGDERAGQFKDHLVSIECARDAGLTARVHAGELLGAPSVAEAMERLQVTHIAHGIRVAEDSNTAQRVVDRGVYLHVCPSSNVCLGVYREYAAMPLRQLFNAGCLLTINSDDPVLFATDISTEYFVAIKKMGFSRMEVGAMAKNAIRASRMPAKKRDALLEEITMDCV